MLIASLKLLILGNNKSKLTDGAMNAYVLQEKDIVMF